MALSLTWLTGRNLGWQETNTVVWWKRDAVKLFSVTCNSIWKMICQFCPNKCSVCLMSQAFFQLVFLFFLFFFLSFILIVGFLLLTLIKLKHLKVKIKIQSQNTGPLFINVNLHLRCTKQCKHNLRLKLEVNIRVPLVKTNASRKSNCIGTGWRMPTNWMCFP